MNQSESNSALIIEAIPKKRLNESRAARRRKERREEFCFHLLIYLHRRDFDDVFGGLAKALAWIRSRLFFDELAASGDEEDGEKIIQLHTISVQTYSSSSSDRDEHDGETKKSFLFFSCV